MLTIDLITRAYTHELNGLSRYDRALHAGLAARGDIDVALRPVAATAPRLARWVRRASGLDLAAFLSVYPLQLPSGTGDLFHLTTSSHAMALHRLRRPAVVTVHDIIHYTFRHNRRLSTYRHLIQRICDALSLHRLHRATAISASSAFTKRQLVQQLGIPLERVVVVPLGIDAQRFSPRCAPPAFYAQYGLQPDTPYVLHVSSEEPRKNIRTLLRAWALVRRHYPHAVLLKVGRCLYPEERRRLNRQIAELGLGASVRFVDAVPDDDLALFYAIARVFTLPSLAEGFGFPVLEAMACGTPVVCSNAGSLPEVAGAAALLVEPTDSAGLAEALCAVLADPALAERLRCAGLAQAAAFSWDRTVTETVSLYQAVTAGKPPWRTG